MLMIVSYHNFSINVVQDTAINVFRYEPSYLSNRTLKSLTLQIYKLCFLYNTDISRVMFKFPKENNFQIYKISGKISNAIYIVRIYLYE